MNPYLVGGVALVIAIMGWQLKSSVTRNGELEAKLETQAVETLECTSANATSVTAINTLETTIATMIEERRVDTVRREEILNERNLELERARAESDRLRDVRDDELDTNPDCAELSALSVDFFCPATGRQLRERSAGASGNGDTDG
jgi:hypothetical protein